MATIIQLRDGHRSDGASVDGRVLGLLTGSLLLALVVVVGPSMIGFAVAGLFAAGMILTHVEHRPLRPAEFAAISALHAAAVVLLAI